MLKGRELVLNVYMTGLYYHNTVDRTIIIINTVEENCKGFTCQEYDGSKSVYRTLGIVGYLSEQDFTNMVSSNIIKNFPVMPRNI